MDLLALCVHVCAHACIEVKYVIVTDSGYMWLFCAVIPNCQQMTETDCRQRNDQCDNDFERKCVRLLIMFMFMLSVLQRHAPNADTSSQWAVAGGFISGIRTIWTAPNRTLTT